VVVSRNAINAASNAVIAVPCTSYRAGRRLYPSQVLILAPEAGLAADSVALTEQVRVLAKSRLLRRRGAVSAATMTAIERALIVALDLP
jgi:mRNA interferase MazF